MRHFLALAVLSVAFARPAFAEDEDLVPLVAPKKTPAKPKPAPKPAPKPKPEVAKPTPPAQGDDDLVPLTRPKGKVLAKFAKPADNVTISIDGKDIGPMTENPFSVEVGEHAIAFKRVGFSNVAKRLTIVLDKTVTVPVAFEAVFAVLSVKADVGMADVFINGKRLRQAPFTGVELPPGQTEISVRKEGYQSSTQTLKLVAGVEYPLSVKLVPLPATVATATSDAPVQHNVTPTTASPTEIVTAPPVEEVKPVTSKWYFWAAIGAAVAAGAVGTVVGVTEYQKGQAPTPLTTAGFCMGGSNCVCINCTAALPVH